MPAIQVDGPLAQTLTNGTRSSPRKRKQGPEVDFTAVSTPAKANKRVKAGKLGPLNASPKPSNRSTLTNKKKIKNDLNFESESEPEAEQRAVAIKKSNKTKTKDDVHLDSDDITATVSNKTISRPKAKAEVTESTAAIIEEELASPPNRKSKAKQKVSETAVLEEREDQVDAEASKKTRRKRKTKEEKEAEAMPLAARTSGLRMFIGAHVSIATGVEKAVTNCVHIG